MDCNSRAERNARIYARRLDGLTLAAIAHEFNLAIETVRDITRRMERKARWRKCTAQLRGAQFALATRQKQDKSAGLRKQRQQ